jgi:hypothetical protein
MRTLGLIQRGTPTSPHDLWTRLNARLHEADEMVRVSLPAVGWREAAALAVALGTVAVVPDPLGFLVASGVF